MSKQHIEQLLVTALEQLQQAGHLPVVATAIQIDATKDKQHGDYATNLAMVLAKPAQRKPREIAELLIGVLPSSTYVHKVEIAGPGFINFFLTSDALYQVIHDIMAKQQEYGKSDIGKGKRVLVEFVSSNPTGPLHVGHGRHAAYGAVVSDLLATLGYDVHREYYVNDAGRQMDILAVSVWLRYLIACGESVPFPANGYQGEYITTIARELFAKHEKAFCVAANALLSDLPLDEPQGGDKETYIDAVIVKTKALLGEANYYQIFATALDAILADISEDLAEFGVSFQSWFSERAFSHTDAVDRVIAMLRTKGLIYEKEGAIWFKSTELGDDKDRVLQRKNGVRTYFGNDLAYHINKFERGFDLAINIFGSDHHGYVARVLAGIKAAGLDTNKWICLLMQFVSLYRGGKQVQMSTRSGSFVTLRELREEVGNDAARYFYIMRKCEQPMDFDLDLAKSQSNDNPVFYVQYAHARICSVFRQLAEKKLTFEMAGGLQALSMLTTAHELQLVSTLSRYTEVITNAALQYEPHILTNYLRDLAADFHAYYNSQQFLVDDIALRNARLVLITATQQILLNGLKLIGVSAPTSM